MSRPKIPQRLKELVYERARYFCEYCFAQSRYSGPFSIEHVIPLAKGGDSNFDNLASTCQYCDSYKYTKTHAIDPVTQLSVSLYNPRKDRWAEHFAWNEDYSKIIGITSFELFQDLTRLTFKRPEHGSFLYVHR